MGIINWLFKKEIGLDIGSRTIKGLHLKKKGKKVVLDRYFFYDLTESNEKFPTITNLTDSLKVLIDINGFSGYQVTSCVSQNDISTFDLSLPIMPAADLRAAISSEIEQLITFPIAEASISHIVISKENLIHVKAFCVRLSDVMPTVDLLGKIALTVESIEVPMLSNIAMLEFNGYLDESYHVIVDLGETKTCMALIKGTKLIATHIIEVSLGTINDRLRDNDDISYLDAEKIKKEVTLKVREAGAAQQVVELVYIDLIKELQRGIEYFQITTNDTSIQKIYAIGGGSQYTSLLSLIEASCGIETLAPNPFRNIEIFNKDSKNSVKIGTIAPHMGTAVGLALRKLNAG